MADPELLELHRREEARADELARRVQARQREEDAAFGTVAAELQLARRTDAQLKSRLERTTAAHQRGLQELSRLETSGLGPAGRSVAGVLEPVVLACSLLAIILSLGLFPLRAVGLPLVAGAGAGLTVALLWRRRGG